MADLLTEAITETGYPQASDFKGGCRNCGYGRSETSLCAYCLIDNSNAIDFKHYGDLKTIYIDPHPAEMHRLLLKSDYQMGKGILDRKGRRYFWVDDSPPMHHEEAAEHLAESEHPMAYEPDTRWISDTPTNYDIHKGQLREHKTFGGLAETTILHSHTPTSNSEEKPYKVQSITHKDLETLRPGDHVELLGKPYPIVDYGHFSEMKGKYPEAAKQALETLPEHLHEGNLGRTWVIRTNDQPEQHWMVGSAGMKLVGKRVIYDPLPTANSLQKFTTNSDHIDVQHKGDLRTIYKNPSRQQMVQVLRSADDKVYGHGKGFITLEGDHYFWADDYPSLHHYAASHYTGLEDNYHNLEKTYYTYDKHDPANVIKAASDEYSPGEHFVNLVKSHVLTKNNSPSSTTNSLEEKYGLSAVAEVLLDYPDITYNALEAELSKRAQRRAAKSAAEVIHDSPTHKVIRIGGKEPVPNFTPDKPFLEQRDAYDKQYQDYMNKSAAAACEYAKGTKWCTGGEKGMEGATHYLKQAPLYVFFQKDSTGTAHKVAQGHFNKDKYEFQTPENKPKELDEEWAHVLHKAGIANEGVVDAVKKFQPVLDGEVLSFREGEPIRAGDRQRASMWYDQHHRAISSSIYADNDKVETSRAHSNALYANQGAAIQARGMAFHISQESPDHPDAQKLADHLRTLADAHDNLSAYHERQRDLKRQGPTGNQESLTTNVRGWKQVGPTDHEKVINGVQVRLANLTGDVGKRHWNIGTVHPTRGVEWHETARTRAEAEDWAEIIAQNEAERRAAEEGPTGNAWTEESRRKAAETKKLRKSQREAYSGQEALREKVESALEHVGTPEEVAHSRKLAEAKIASAPTPSPEEVVKARAELVAAKEQGKRAGGESRGGSALARRRQRQRLFQDWGGNEKGYIVCPWNGQKLHYTKDPIENPNGYETFERGKIFTKAQGGGYQYHNLIPESFSANRSRSDKPLRTENLE